MRKILLFNEQYFCVLYFSKVYKHDKQIKYTKNISVQINTNFFDKKKINIDDNNYDYVHIN